MRDDHDRATLREPFERALHRLLGARRVPPLTRFATAMMSRTVTVKTDRARQELGYAPVISVEEGLRQMGKPG